MAKKYNIEKKDLMKIKSHVGRHFATLELCVTQMIKLPNSLTGGRDHVSVLLPPKNQRKKVKLSVNGSEILAGNSSTPVVVEHQSENSEC